MLANAQITPKLKCHVLDAFDRSKLSPTEKQNIQVYEFVKTGEAFNSSKEVTFKEDGKFVFLRDNTGKYYISPTLQNKNLGLKAKNEKSLIEQAKEIKEPFLGTHRGLIRKFSLEKSSIVSSGEIVVIHGEIYELNNRSGTFKQTVETLYIVSRELKVPKTRVKEQKPTHANEQIYAALRDTFNDHPFFKKLHKLKLKDRKKKEQIGITDKQIDAKIFELYRAAETREDKAKYRALMTTHSGLVTKGGI